VQDLGGLSEIAKTLGISRQRAETLTHYEGFPTPVGKLARGRLWDLDAVRAWAKATGRAVKGE
jgi:hypothetical protein